MRPRIINSLLTQAGKKHGLFAEHSPLQLNGTTCINSFLMKLYRSDLGIRQKKAGMIVSIVE